MREPTSVKFEVTVHEEDDGSYWSEVKELPGCFASGFSLDEVLEATYDAMQLWLPDGIKLGEPTWGPTDGTKTKTPAHNRRRKLQLCA